MSETAASTPLPGMQWFESPNWYRALTTRERRGLVGSYASLQSCRFQVDVFDNPAFQR